MIHPENKRFSQGIKGFRRGNQTSAGFPGPSLLQDERDGGSILTSELWVSESVTVGERGPEGGFASLDPEGGNLSCNELLAAFTAY